MSEPIVFKHENYNIASDIRLEADVAYIQGQPIVKTKTVVLYYRDKTFRAGVYGSKFQELLVMHVTRPQYTIELINYLSRLINHDNLFEIYVNNRNTEKYNLEELTFAKQENDKQGGPTLFNKTEYSEGLLDDHEQFILKELLKTMNTRFSRTFTSINELDYIPVYGYISSSTSISRTSEPILHLSIVFNVLAHQDRFSGINNQEAIASFNSIMKAKRLNITTQDLNEHEYKNEIKRLKLELKREQQRAKGLEIKNKTLEEKIEEMSSKLDVSAQQVQTLQVQTQTLQNSLNEANAKLDTQTQALIQAHTERDEIKAQANGLQTTLNKLQDVVIESAQTLHDELHAAGDMVREQFTKMNVTTSSRAETIDVWKIRELDDYYHINHLCEENEHVFDTYCGDATKPSRINQHRFKPKDTDELIGSYPNANAIDLAVFLRRHQEHYPHVRMDRNRKLIYSGDDFDEVKALLIAYSDEGDGRVIEVVDSFEVHSQNAGNQMITHLQAIFNQQQANAQAIAQLQQQEQTHHQEAMNAIANIEEHVEAIEEKLTTFQLFKQKHPKAKQIRHRHFYRYVYNDENDRAWCEDTKGGAHYYLTEDDINNGSFR